MKDTPVQNISAGPTRSKRKLWFNVGIIVFTLLLIVIGIVVALTISCKYK